MMIPSIDLMDGKAVQLQQGQKKVIERDDVFALLEEFSLYGEVALIDLDAAMGQGDNQLLIEQLLQRKPCRVGGGIRDLATARRYLAAGASKIILGTAATADWVNELPRNALVFAIDAKGDYLTTHGWQQTQNQTVSDAITQLAPNCGEFLYTQVNNEGMMQGIDKPRISAVIQQSPRPVTVAGGISTVADLTWIAQQGGNAQIGMAIYSGAIQLDEALMAMVDFDKADLIPTVVQDIDSRQVLMLAYSNRASLQQALKQKRGIYYSRSRQELWRKGDTSGDVQQLIQVDVDCDGDTLLFLVKQTNQACHLNRYSCFASQQLPYSLNYLDDLFNQRLNQNLQQPSFTQQLLTSTALQIEKLEEECQELIEAKSHSEVRWEAADVIFFALAMAKARGVSYRDIINELRSRNHER
ncbi:phosphoribosyl-AMP cyclohydrolase [Marinicella gelatinilytica]|uniref:phosphoribosyl-AMP cyclohydrolase n=1 Tax=Marinicella gelatinilytica TaxID=2996017 RepID=UPI002260F113|nr:phosphoribosyl-AMP cyclohydrolase [Marinicella gelatinilytica]MCX7544232.1 phosphoribosyl-AMP cyclohydrolase [Marinicella gelatinilytica]